MNTTDYKKQFRNSAAWKNLRLMKFAEQKVDPVTGSKLQAKANLHHLDENPEHYTDISDPTHFVLLNYETHSVLHYLWGDGKRRYDWRKRLDALRKLCEQMDCINSSDTVKNV